VIDPSSYSAVLRRSFRKTFPPAVRGEGVYLWDTRGKRYLDFSGSAAVNFIGHGVVEIAAAMATQAKQLEFVHSSQFTTPVAEEYATELLDFAGKNFAGGCVYFTCGGSESVETALKLARQYQVEIGQTNRYQVISRGQSYHGSTLGALSVSGNKQRREIYRPMVREFAHVGFPYCYRCAFDCTDSCRSCGQEYAAEVDQAITATEGEVAAFILEPVSGATLGAVVPPPGYLQSVAEICHRHGVLLIADEVITGMGRTGRNFAVEHWDVAPDLLVTAKGLSSGYAPLGAVVAGDHIAEPFLHGKAIFNHGFTFGGHPIACATALANIDVIEREGLCEHVLENEGRLRGMLESLRDLPIVGDVRGAGYFHAIELVKDKETKQTFNHEEAEQLLRGFLSGELFTRGLICRTDDRGDPVVQLSPPLIAGEEQFQEIESILRPVLSEAWERMGSWR